jgi:hypothetical protein
VSSAEGLYEAMCRSKAGWTADDLDTLYTGYKFNKRNKGKHAVYTHSSYPQLRASVTRARSLPIGYVQEAVKLIRQLKALTESDPR